MHKRKPQLLIAAGLLGMAGLQVATRFLDLPSLSSDFVRGAWSGACIGLEILGLHLLYTTRRNPDA